MSLRYRFGDEVYTMRVPRAHTRALRRLQNAQ